MRWADQLEAEYGSRPLPGTRAAGDTMHGPAPVRITATTTIKDTSPAAGEDTPPALACPFGRPGTRRSGERCHAGPGWRRDPQADQGTRVIVPFIRAEWPGKLQKNEYGPAPSFATGTLTDVLSPPPTTLLWAITRASPGLM